jgi:hypothetical protein
MSNYTKTYLFVLALITGVCTGPTQVAEIVFRSGPVLGLVQMIVIERYVEHTWPSRAFLFRKENFIYSWAYIMHVAVTKLSIEGRSLRSVSYPSNYNLTPCTSLLGIPGMCCKRQTKLKMFLESSQIIHPRIIGVYELKQTIIDTIVRADLNRSDLILTRIKGGRASFGYG